MLANIVKLKDDFVDIGASVGDVLEKMHQNNLTYMVITTANEQLGIIKNGASNTTESMDHCTVLR